MCFKKLYELLNGPEYKCILSALQPVVHTQHTSTSFIFVLRNKYLKEIAAKIS